MEANQYAFQTTPHKCDAPSAKGFYNWCDKAGNCGQNIQKLARSDYGYGSQYKINTQNEFHVKLEFGWSNTLFTEFKTTMTQGKNSISLYGNCDSNKYLTDDLRSGMIFVITNWSTYDNWLWGNRCKASSCNQGDIIYKNLEFWTGDHLIHSTNLLQ